MLSQNVKTEPMQNTRVKEKLVFNEEVGVLRKSCKKYTALFTECSALRSYRDRFYDIYLPIDPQLPQI